MWSALSLPHLQDPKTAAMMSILKVPASPSPGPARFLNLSFVAGALRSERVRGCVRGPDAINATRRVWRSWRGDGVPVGCCLFVAHTPSTRRAAMAWKAKNDADTNRRAVREVAHAKS